MKFSDKYGNTILIKETPWDARVTNLNTCEIVFDLVGASDANHLDLLKASLEWIESSTYDYVQTRIDSADRNLRILLENYGYRLTEHSYKLSCTNPAKISNGMGLNTGLILKKLETDFEFSFARDIALKDFHHGRLLEDTLIPLNQARARSFNWIDDLVKEPYTFYVAYFREKLIGFHCEQYLAEKNHLKWILTGSSANYSMLSVPLWAAAFYMAKIRNVEKIDTMISAANYKVLNLYNQYPFRIEASLFGYHKLRR